MYLVLLFVTHLVPIIALGRWAQDEQVILVLLLIALAYRR